MDLNRMLYDNLVMTYDSSKKHHNPEGAGIIFDTFKNNSLTINDYSPDFDYENLYKEISDETTKVIKATYKSGFDDDGNKLSSFLDGINSSLFITKKIAASK